MSGRPQPGARRPLCDGCRRQRVCLELDDGRRLCSECRSSSTTIIVEGRLLAEPGLDARLVRVLLERSMTG